MSKDRTTETTADSYTQSDHFPFTTSMANAEKVLCVLGAGPNVGASVARKFASQGYKVAVVSRKKKDIVEGQLHVDGDFCDPSSMQDVFSEIRRSLGIPSVVVYNGESVVDEVSKSGEPT